MPIVVNGTTIPENVANALNVNGTNITSVVCNGVTVWTQSLFSALWSGSSFGNNIGLETSGSSWRFKGSVAQGAWQTFYTNGTFSGNSTCEELYNQMGFVVSGNLIRAYVESDKEHGWITFTLASKAFSGTSYASCDVGEGLQEVVKLETSGGLVRYVSQAGYTSLKYGAYISVS